MAWRECTNCGYKMLPFEPRKRRGDHLLCKGCAAKPASSLKTTAAEEGTPGADLSSDFEPVNPLVEKYRTPVSTNEHGHPINHVGLPTSVPQDPDTEFWPDNDDMGPPGHPLTAPLPNSMWLRYAQRRVAMGHPAVHKYNRGAGIHKQAHSDGQGDHGFGGSHSHHPYSPVVTETGPVADHLLDSHLGADGVTHEKLIDAAGDQQALKKLHLDAHDNEDDAHGYPAGISDKKHQHLHNDSHVSTDPSLADWEKELLGQAGNLDADEPQQDDGAAAPFEKPWPVKIKNHLKDEHHIDEQAISGSDLFNHDYHDDLHEHGADHTHAPKPETLPYMAPLPDHSSAQAKAHLVIGHGHSPHDVSYLTPSALAQVHEDAHDQQPADHQHEDDTAPAKYGTGDGAAAHAHLTDDHDLSGLDHGWQHNVEKHALIHKTKHNDWSQPHHHGDEPFSPGSPPPNAPGGATYQAMIEHLKQGGSHKGNYYNGWEHGESFPSLVNAHKTWHEHYGPHDHEHEDLADPLDAGSVKSLQQAEQGGLQQHPHHDDMDEEEFAAHMAGPGHEWSSGSDFLSKEHGLEQHDTDHSMNKANDDHTHASQGEEPVQPEPKSKKPNSLPQFGDRLGQEPEMYAWPHPEVPHPKNKSEVISHLMDHHPEVSSEDYENSEFKNDGFLKAWHSHLHSGKEHDISPSDMHQHVNDDSKAKALPTDNTFSHLVTHHGYSEDEAKSMRHVDAVSRHEHLHTEGDDEQIGHQHDYPGAPPSEPQSWFVNPEHAGENYEHLVYHGTRHDYYCPTCGSTSGSRNPDCADCGEASKPANATLNKRDRGEWGNYGNGDWNCHIVPHFTTLYQMAKNFGHRVVAAKIKGKKPKYYDNLNHFAHDSYDRLHAMGELHDGGQYLGKHHTNSYGSCCSDTLLEYAKGKHRTDGKYGMRRVRDSLRADGYDHIVVRNHADSPRGNLNVFPLSPKQVHIVDEDYEVPHGDRRQNDTSSFNPPSGWSADTLMHEKDKIRPPAYLVDKDPRLGETKHPEDMTGGEFRDHMNNRHSGATETGKDEAGLAEHEALHAAGNVSDHHHGVPLPKDAPEHPDDQGDPEKGEVGSGGFNHHDDDDDDNDNDQYCSNCDTDGHGTYDDHCGECEQYTGDGECGCSYCSACGYSTSHGDDPVGSGAHEYCEHCDEGGVEGGVTDHSSDEHEDEYGEHPTQFKDADYCPHCDTHDKENRDSDHCQNCGGDLPDYEKVNAPGSQFKGQYPMPGGGNKQWDHKTHPWGHLTHDHGLDLSDKAYSPDDMAQLHQQAHTGGVTEYKPGAYSNGASGPATHDPEHGHDEYPQTQQWSDMSKDDKIAHLAVHHNGQHANLNSLTEDDLNSKHVAGHLPHYSSSRTPHQHVEDGSLAPAIEHAPENIANHMKLFHATSQPESINGYTDEQLHKMHAEHHGLGHPYNAWHHNHTENGLQLTGEHEEPPTDAANHIAAIEHLHEHHTDTNTLPSLGYPMASVEKAHLDAHKKGPMAPHDHPVSEGPHPDEDPWGHLQTQHGWTEKQVADYKDYYGDDLTSAKTKHVFEHAHNGASEDGSIHASDHSHFGTPDKPIPAIPKAYKPPSSQWSTYEAHAAHMKDVHGLDAPAGQSQKFYKDLHYSLHKDPAVSEELGLAESHDHHEHSPNGGPSSPLHPYVHDDSYAFHNHMTEWHPEALKGLTNTFNQYADKDSTGYAEAVSAHNAAHANAPEWVHTHKPDPNAPIHPNKPHLNDELLKHMVVHHAADKDDLGGMSNEDIVAQHAGHHGNVYSGLGALHYNHDDPASASVGAHSHSAKVLKKLHGTDIEDGKPTKFIHPTTDFNQISKLKMHLSGEHPELHDGSNWHDSSVSALSAAHDAAHSETAEGTGPDHVHQQVGEPAYEEDHDPAHVKAKDIEHVENHHGLIEHGLGDQSPGMVKMLHEQMHQSQASDAAIPHNHNDFGTDGIQYPPPKSAPNVHNAHDLAHHLEDEHGASGTHGYDQQTLLAAHVAAHSEMKGQAAQGKPEHVHSLMYPFGHPEGPQPKQISALGDHMANQHYAGTDGKSPEQIAAMHEEAHLDSQSHKHTTEEMQGLHASKTVSMPPLASPHESVHGLESHLSNGHNLSYSKQADSGITTDNIEDWHNAEHAKASLGHVHQVVPKTYQGVQPYPENPMPHVADEHALEHLKTDHGIDADEHTAAKIHQTIHNGYATDHQHQPAEIPTITSPGNFQHGSMQAHLTHGHGFSPETVSDDLDMPALHKMHQQSHADQASLPFHNHTADVGPKHLKPLDEMQGLSPVVEHIKNHHGLPVYNDEGDYKSTDEYEAQHAAHHAEHDGLGGLLHHHAPAEQVVHHSAMDPDALKEHMETHHGNDVGGLTPGEYHAEHTYQHNYNSGSQTKYHNHLAPPPVAHADMTKPDLVKHLNDQHNTPGLIGTDPLEYYQKLHADGHAGYAEPGKHPYLPENNHAHPDLTNNVVSAHPGIHPGNVQDHMDAMHGGAAPGGVHKNIQLHNADHAEHVDMTPHDHGEPEHIPAPSTPGSPVTVPHPSDHADLNDHLVNTHGVGQHHYELHTHEGSAELHTKLHDEPEDENDSGHEHGNVPSGPQPTPKVMLHPGGLNMEMHLQQHGMPHHLLASTPEGLHNQHAYAHKQGTMGEVGPHTHANWTGEGDGLTTQSSLRDMVQFFEREWAVD